VSRGAARDWDAASYEAVATPQEQWGMEVIERLDLRGDETVLDAGSGSGRLTRHLIERLPHGRVVCVDASPSMVEQVREVLRPGDSAICCDLLELDLAEPLDAIFSGATFHWVLDHDRLFERLHDALRPGGRLEAQCGGAGNVAEFLAACRQVREEEAFAPHFEDWTEPYLFAAPE
jgi:trans-aconitate 2-methyltransferase